LSSRLTLRSGVEVDSVKCCRAPWNRYPPWLGRPYTHDSDDPILSSSRILLTLIREVFPVPHFPKTWHKPSEDLFSRPFSWRWHSGDQDRRGSFMGLSHFTARTKIFSPPHAGELFLPQACISPSSQAEPPSFFFLSQWHSRGAERSSSMLFSIGAAWSGE